MFANLFGKFLIDNEYLTPDQFLQIKLAEDKTRVKLGLIAVSEKLMTEAQTEKVNRKQMLEDRRFGDIAIELGFLTNLQVERLLSLQGNPYMQFCQTVTDRGFMTLQQIEDTIQEFQKENSFTASDIEDIKSGDIDRILPIYLPEAIGKNVSDLLSVAVRCANRFVSNDISVARGYITNSYTTIMGAAQSTTDGFLCQTIVSGDEKGMLAVAEGFGKEFFDEVSIEALDSVGEFVNIVNGLFATAKSQEGIEIELAPPEFLREPATIKGDICVLPITVNQEYVDLVIKVG